jgi:hypothetical protein
MYKRARKRRAPSDTGDEMNGFGTYNPTILAPRNLIRWNAEIDSDTMAVDASDLGLRPGYWPEAIAVPTSDGADRRWFYQGMKVVNVEEELTAVKYVDHEGRFTLVVIND